MEMATNGADDMLTLDGQHYSIIIELKGTEFTPVYRRGPTFRGVDFGFAESHIIGRGKLHNDVSGGC